MKEYFKYGNGYVNIDAENLFLTNSGNWSETHYLLEKSAKSIRRNNLKSFKINAYLFVVGCLALFFLVKSDSRIIQAGTVVLGLASYFYMKRETGRRYKIPISKIKEIQLTGNQAKIIFRNLSGSEDVEIIDGVEGKGLLILKDLTWQNTI